MTRSVLQELKHTPAGGQGGRSEESALDNAFMFSLIESCKLNGLAPEKYITFLLRKLKGADQYTDKNALLPCFCTA